MKGTNIKKTVIHQWLEPGLTKPALGEHVGPAVRNRLPGSNKYGVKLSQGSH